MGLSRFALAALAALAGCGLRADGLSLMDLLAAEIARPPEPSILEKGYRAEKVPAKAEEAESVAAAGKPAQAAVGRPVTNVVEKVVERVVEKPVEVVVERTVTNVVERVKVVERPVTNVVERVVEKPVEVVVEKAVTNVLRQVVRDRSAEARLAREKRALADEKAKLEASHRELERKLAAAQAHGARVAREHRAQKRQALTGRPANITAKTTYYDRKRGVVFFDRDVWVDDEQYQLHADKAFVFMSSTNDVKRIVALGHIALTNDFRRAYGAKVSYYRRDGMVVLYGADGRPAEIVDESKAEDQIVRGSCIRFWVDSEQVEVRDAAIVAPSGGVDLGGAIGPLGK